jgi:hypothetical protein
VSRAQQLEDDFRAARMFDPAELRGAYAVRMLTLMPSLHRLGHRKVFLGGSGCGAGTNMFFGNVAWGRFSLETGVQEGPEPLQVVVINYDCPENLPPTRLVRDHVRCQEPGRRYLGKLNVLVVGRLRFLAYFLLVTAGVPAR